MSNYPPGVTGNEPEIAGYPPCVKCGHLDEEHEEPSLVGGILVGTSPCEIEGCECEDYQQWG